MQAEKMVRHVLVVGGAGYIGNVLIRRLLQLGYFVRCLDCLLYPTGSTIAPLLDEPSFSFVKGDIRSKADVERSLEGITDVVVLAALVGDPISKKYPELTREINFAATRDLFFNLNGRGIRKLVFTSTCSNYGLSKHNEIVSESSPLNPKSIYAETKVAIEQLILDNLGRADFHPTILRLATAFGLSPRMRFDLTISEFSRELALDKELSVFDQKTWRPYCHVLDISEAIVYVLEAEDRKVSGQVFNVGGNENNFTKEMVINEILKTLPSARVVYRDGGTDARDYRVSFDKFDRILGFRPSKTVADAIQTVIGCVRSNLYPDVESRRAFYGNYVI